MTNLFDLVATGPGSRASDPWTSHEAALTCKANDRRLVLAAHAKHPGGLTDFELADIVGRQQTSAGKRRGELRDDGYIEATDMARPAPSGRNAMVWRITADGLSVARLAFAPKAAHQPAPDCCPHCVYEEDCASVSICRAASKLGIKPAETQSEQQQGEAA